ncbi:glutamate racemase [Peptoniphilus stercorisuis]|uniref:Glutamate racemase n=1 Tax=Peptoniphilus stercorisuis TaxID=1436965 RepID=A0ABS4KCA6_9FIRM|nr:glutamate racemase [Peptoniphilus stercorisuis]MBP2025413.1 glutamate racemase [Peptoniphilus stercorisuis]
MNFFDERPIGLFDSGVGGLSVLKKMREVFPKENFIYIADTLRVPYGDRSPEEIKNFTIQCFGILKEQNIKSGIIACNTSTCYGLDGVCETYDFPTLGVVLPAIKDAIKATDNKKVLLLGTNATVNSGLYENTMSSLDSEIEIKSQGCPDLVVAIEEGHGEDDIGYEICKQYLDPYKDFDYDTLILGCTHFPLAESNIRLVLREQEKDVRIVNPAFATAKEMEELLKNENKLNNKGSGKIKFLVSGDESKFKFVAADVLNLREDEIDIEKFNPESK